MTKKILIATPVYAEAVPDFSKSLAAAIHIINKNGMHCAWLYLSGVAMIHLARNRLTQEFRNTEFTDILWWDADIGVEPEDVLRLVQHDFAVVGGAAPYRFGNREGFPANIKRDKDGYFLGDPGKGLIAASMIPTAMLKVHRSVFDRIEALGMAPLRIEYDPDTNQEMRRHRSFFDYEVDESRHQEYGEDVTFCRKCQRAGFELWIEPNMTLRHHSMLHRVGNLCESLKK